MKIKHIIVFVIFIIILGGICISILNFYPDHDTLTFNSLESAEKQIGDIKTPHLPEDYTVERITYYNDGFTHPVTKVFYTKEKHQIIFMEASGHYEQSPYELINSDYISDIRWISDDSGFVLRWRESNQQSYKFLITDNKDDKSCLISVAENFSTSGDSVSNNHGEYFIVTD